MPRVRVFFFPGWVAGITPSFDFLSTESGFAEFIEENCTNMLHWMSYAADYTMSKYQKRTFIKAHCSTGQTCKAYPDPRTQQPVNFNFLPMFASKELGVMPHTVQIPAWDDPAGWAYGNTNFQVG